MSMLGLEGFKNPITRTNILRNYAIVFLGVCISRRIIYHLIPTSRHLLLEKHLVCKTS